MVSYHLSGSIIVKINNFSNEDLHISGKPSEFIVCGRNVSLVIKEQIKFECFANGMNDETKGYISLRFHVPPVGSYKHDIKILEDVLIVSVLDAERNTHFSQSLSFFHTILKEKEVFPEFGFEKFIERKTLLDDSPSLLPADSLTLMIHISQSVQYESIPLFIEGNLKYCFGKDDKHYHLLLDSTISPLLYHSSTFVQGMLQSQWKESETGTMRILDEYYPAFKNIIRILMGSKYIQAATIHDISLLYEVAHKYDFQIVIAVCRELFEKCLCDANVDLLQSVAQLYSDIHLETIIKKFQSNSQLRRKQNEENIQWTCQSQQTEIEHRLEFEMPFYKDRPDVLIYNPEFPACDRVKQEEKWQSLEDKPDFEFYR